MEVGERDMAMQTHASFAPSGFGLGCFLEQEAPGPEDTGTEAGQGKGGQFCKGF